MSLKRAKLVAANLLRELQRPMVLVALSHEARGALTDTAAELIEVNQRLDAVEALLAKQAKGQ